MIGDGVVPLTIRRPTHSGYNCDDCKHYRWYYDRCDKWGTAIDAREVHNCFEPREEKQNILEEEGE